MVPEADSENAAPEKQQPPPAAAAVLGDATNTYCTGQRPPIVPDTKPNVTQRRSILGLHTPPGEAIPSMPRSMPQRPAEGVPQGDNPQHAAEYVQDIFKVLKREEPLHMPSPSYMERQVHVSIKMRAILIDWLVDVHKKYKLRSETLFLAVQLIDRYLDAEMTAQRHLQLVGVTALMIAAKFEEVHPPQIKEFVYVTDKAYSQEEILKMEVCILKALQFKICCPTAMHFFEQYQTINGCTETHRHLAQYLLELTLVDYKALKYTPLHLAAACLLLSNKLLRQPSWTSTAAQHTKMTEPMLKECAKEMCALLERAEGDSLQAIRKKYSQSKYNAVAKLNFMAGPESQVAGCTRRSIGGA